MKTVLVWLGTYVVEKLWRRFFPSNCDHDWALPVDKDGNPVPGPIERCTKCAERRVVPRAQG